MGPSMSTGEIDGHAGEAEALGPGPAVSRPVVPWTRWLLFWAVAAAGIAFDLTTKSAVFRALGEPYMRAPVTVIPNVLELQTSYNTGALWGFGRGWRYSSLLFAGLSVVAAAAIVYWLFVLGAAADRRLTLALALIMAGALGNCYDRLVLGHVRDFVHFHVDPIGFDCAIFNFADNMLVIGATALILLALRPEPAPDGGPSLSGSPSRPATDRVPGEAS